MPVEPPASITLSMNVGRTSLRIGTYRVDAGDDAMAKAEVIDKLVRRVLAEWPSLVYSDQIQALVREKCRKTTPE
ncbi:MAG: hypothetical protein WBY44_31120 [Bryobacteraceae bacterium]